jgi:hypothetical protein
MATVPSTSAATGTASLTIHSRFCPPGYDGSDICNDCHGTIGLRSVEFSVYATQTRFNFAALPDESGNVLLTDLVSGEYTVSSSISLELATPRVYCSSGDGSDGQWMDHHPTEYGWGYYPIPVAAGEAVTCDWYFIPAEDYSSTRSSITIHDRFCPVGFSDFGNEWRDCLPTLGASSFLVYLSGPTKTHDSLRRGDVTFTWIEAGGYRISNDMLYPDLPGSIYCSTFDSLGSPFLSQSLETRGSFELTVDPGDEVICDWYHYPTAEIYQGGIESPIAVIACETPTTFQQFSGNTYEGCEGVMGVDLTVYPSLEPQFAQTCVYTGYPSCYLNLPNMIPLTVEIDESDIPAGYAPQCNPCTWWQYGEWTGFIVQLNPTDASSKGD